MMTISASLLLAAVQQPALVWISPFVALLLAIAILPLIPRVDHWWHHNRNKLLIALVLSAFTLAHYYLRGFGYGHGEHSSTPGWPTVVSVLQHALVDEFFPFITLLFSLYVIAGGIVVRGDLRATPLVNTAILAIGGVLANAIGTTGASLLLIRLLLKTNSERTHVVHTMVFFIFIVSNIGGCLLPIGDPPLFLGYLRGVPFFWTLVLWKEWAVMLGLMLATYFVIDWVKFRQEPPIAHALDAARRERLSVAGLSNVLWLIGVVAAVALLVPGKALPGTTWIIPPYLREGVQLACAALSLALTSGRLRRENEFNYVAIGEVACLFIGIFITMQTPIELLHGLAPRIAASDYTQPWVFFWATGLLSSLLDNAPTYVVFFETANHLTHAAGPGIVRLVDGNFIREDLLIAISCGAVFMGANTYIGNGPNFMVKAIAEQAGVKMPSFFGYLLWSGLILLPLFVIITLIFFR